MARIASDAWGGSSYEITQEYGVNLDSIDDDDYAYAATLGMPYGSHVGLDIGMPRGTAIYALNPGKVEFAGFSDSFRPRPVWIKTRDNPETQQNESGHMEIYGHLWENTVSTGNEVREGQALGISGEQTIRGTMSPDGSGPHLHFELRKPGNTQSGWQAVNPIGWLTRKSGSLVPDAEPPRENPDEPPSGLPGVPGLDIGGLIETAKDYGSRAILLAIGLAILLIGLNSVLKASGINPSRGVKKTAKTVAKVIPATRLIRRK